MLKSTTLCAAVALAVGFTFGGMPGTASAASLNSFTVSEGSLNGTDGIVTTPANTVTADTIDFSYNTIIAATAAGSFTETGSLTFATYRVGGEGGSIQSSYLDNGCSSVGGCSTAGYQMFANFTAHGTDTLSGGVFSFVVTSFTYDLYVTPNQATNDQSQGGLPPCTQNANYQCSTTNSATAYLVASGTLSDTGPSDGTIPTPGSGVSQGTWGIYSTVNPATLDTGFFSSPSPFYLDFAGSGQNQVGALTPTGTNTFTVTDGGTGFLEFAVPEPASMMLFGSGLLGLGLGALRRKTKKNA